LSIEASARKILIDFAADNYLSADQILKLLHHLRILRRCHQIEWHHLIRKLVHRHQNLTAVVAVASLRKSQMSIAIAKVIIPTLFCGISMIPY